MKRLVALVCLAALMSACGSSPTTPTNTGSASSLSVSNFTATVDGPANALVYHVSMRITETSGKNGATVSALNFTLSGGGTATAPLNPPIRLAAGSGSDTGTVNITDSSGRPVSTSISVSISFSDDAGKASSASGTATVTQIVLVTLSGVITDSATGAPIAGAIVRVISAPNSGVTATSDAGGRYSLTPLVAGSFAIQVTAAGHISTSQAIAIDRDTPFNIVMVPTPPAAPAVEYRITGNARRCAATYENSSGGTSQMEVDVPFSYTWSTARTGAFLYMSCQIDTGNDRGNITIGLYRNGTLIQSATANGFPNIATVSGSY